VATISERVVELRRGQTIDDVDHDLQSIRKRLSVVIALQIWCQLATQHQPSILVVTVLDGDTSALEIREVLRVGTEEIQVLDAGRMHGGDIQKSHIRVHPR